MTSEDAVRYLELGKLNGLGYRVQGRYVRMPCPFAPWYHDQGIDSNPSFSVVLTEPAKYICFACKQGGLFWQLFAVLGTLRRDPALKELSRHVYKDEFDPARVVARAINDFDHLEMGSERPDMEALKDWYFPNCTPVHREMSRYLCQRGISGDTMRDWSPRWDPWEKRVTIPVWTFDGDFVGVSGRSVNPNVMPRWKHYWGTHTELGWGMPFAEDWKSIQPMVKYVLPVEGPFDAMVTWQHLCSMCMEIEYMPLITFGSRVSARQMDQLELLQLPVMIMFDPDKAGRRGAKEAVAKMENRVPLVKTLHIDRVTKREVGDPAEMDCNELKRVLLEDYLP